MIDLFWLTALIPGFAVLARFFPHDTRRGLLATVSWSYVLTVALMAPFVGFAFWVHLSVRTVAASYGALVLMSAVVAVRAGGLRLLARLVRTTGWFDVGLVLFCVALTVPLGAAAQSDSFAHSAKIRYMRDVGFYLQDAYSPLPVIETKWHVNVHHALFAIQSWLTGAEPLNLWFKTAWFFRLLALGSIGFLGATLFRSRWVGSLAMIGATAVMCTRLTIVFPFSLTAYVVSPVVLALIVDALIRPSLARYARVFLASLTLAGLHFGTWFLVVCCAGPVIVLWIIWKAWAGEWPSAVKPLALSAVTLVTGVPFVLVSALQPNFVVAQQDELHVRMIRTLHLGDWSFTIIDPSQYAWMLPLLAALVLVAVVNHGSRPRLLIIIGIQFFAMLGMFLPGYFDLLVRMVPYWLVQRFRMVSEVIGIVVVAGGMAWLLRPRLNTRLARQAFAVLVLCGSLAVFRQNIQGYVQESFRQKRWLRDAASLQDAVRGYIPPHSLVAADPEWSLVLPAVQLTRVMAQDLHHANPSDGGLLERYADAQELLADQTSQDRRQAIILKNKIGFILLHDATGVAPTQRFHGLGSLVTAKNGFALYRVSR